MAMVLMIMGCSSSATIRTHHGTYEAIIVRSDAQNVYVVDEDIPGSPEQSIAREDIEDIDHPGNVSAIVGAWLANGLVVTGAFLIAGSGCWDDPESLDCALGVPLGVSALLVAALPTALAVSNYLIWRDSVDNAQASEPSSLSIAPTIAPHNNGVWFGVSMELLW